jgi:proline iminopeptidase
MWGPSEFTASGTLKNYDATPRLGEIKVPTLFIAGEFDEARSVTVQHYQSLVPGARFALMKNAGHLTMQDNPQQDIEAVNSFLQSIENKQ